MIIIRKPVKVNAACCGSCNGSGWSDGVNMLN